MGASIAACAIIVLSLGIFFNNSKSDLSDSLEKNTENFDYYMSQNINAESDDSIDKDSEDRGMTESGSAIDDQNYKERKNIIVGFNQPSHQDNYSEDIPDIQITASTTQASGLEVLVCIDADKGELDTFVKELLEEYDYSLILEPVFTSDEKTDQNNYFRLTIEIKTEQLEDFLNEITIKYPNLTLEVPDNIDSEFVYVIISTKDE